MSTAAADVRPIFVVGNSRSGTSMLREMLNQHSLLWLTRETHYFDDLRMRLGEHARKPMTEEARRACAAYFLQLANRPYGQAEEADGEQAVDLDDLRRRARELGDTGDAYFEAFCRMRADQHGRKRWGEKTPRHVYRIPDLLTAFPSAQVICLVRDPRGVVASYRDWKRSAPTEPEDDSTARDRKRIQKSYNVVLQALLWRSAMQAGVSAEHAFGPERVRLQSYEELVSDPEASMNHLCQWLGVDYEEAMLDVPLVQSSYDGAAEHPSTAPVARWRSKLSASEVAVIQACCGSLMEKLGYPAEKTDASAFQVARAWLSVPAAVVRAALVNRGRIGRMPNYLARRLSLALRRAGSPAASPD